MPEAAEVFSNVSELQELEGQRVRSATVLSGRYTRKPIEHLDTLVGQTLQSVRAHGKLVVWTFDNSVALNTYGMTGFWSPYQSKHSRLELHFDVPAYYTDMRNFGTFKVLTPEAAQRIISTRTVSVMDQQAPPADLETRVAKHGKKATIAELMLDQRVFNGVGNYMRADVMYRVGVDPRAPANSISVETLHKLWKESHDISHRALRPDFTTEVYGRRSIDGKEIKRFVDSNKRAVWYVEDQHLPT